MDKLHEKIKSWMALPLIEKVGSRIRLFIEKRKKKETTTYFSEDVFSEEKANGLYAGAVLLLALTILVTIIVSLVEWLKPPVTEIVRPSFGDTEEWNFHVKDGQETVDVPYKVRGTDLSKEEWEAFFDRAFQENAPLWLGDNESYSHITRRLSYFAEDDYGIRYSFHSSDREKLSDHGSIFADEIPESGTTVTVTVTLSYEEYSKDYTLSMTLFPISSDFTEKESITDLLTKADTDSKKEKTFVLPTEHNGTKLSFQKAGTNPLSILLFGILMAVFVVLIPEWKRKKAEEKRREDLETSYSAIVSKMNLLVQANMSIRSAWTKVVEDYDDSLKKGSFKKNYAYEEMRRALNEMSAGTNEEKAYEDFGRRCGEHTYIRLANMLSQNLRQGIKGLKKSMEAEQRTALTERKNRAIRRGEEAGTKLLFPMIVLLGIVIALLIVPAFLSF